MKKKNIIVLILTIGITLGLFAFASLYKYEDSHLRVNGIRVKVDDYALMVDDCSEKNDWAEACWKKQ